MKTVSEIVFTESKTDKHNKPYVISYIRVEGGDELYRYFGSDVEVGNELEIYHNEKWNINGARRTPKKKAAK